jgi:hypothetical protein
MDETQVTSLGFVAVRAFFRVSGRGAARVELPYFCDDVLLLQLRIGPMGLRPWSSGLSGFRSEWSNSSVLEFPSVRRNGGGALRDVPLLPLWRSLLASLFMVSLC